MLGHCNNLWETADESKMPPFSPAFIGPPPLNVKDVIDRAVNSHVIVVPGHVEGTVKFNGPLLSKTNRKATLLFSLEGNRSDGVKVSSAQATVR